MWFVFFDINFFQAYVGHHNGYDEIFLNEPYDPNAYYNFSDLGMNCRNPQFFVGEYSGPSSFYFYITWEALVNSSWKIYYSKTSITWGGIEETSNNKVNNVTVSPNPFKDAFEIQFDLAQSIFVQIDLLDKRGQIIAKLFSGNCSQGNFSRHFIVPEPYSNTGINFVRFKVGESVFHKKVIRMHY